jgi:hypothetical protein
MNKINTQIVEISCLCVGCEKPTTKMVLSTRLYEVMLLCYNCHLIRLNELKKGLLVK